MITITNDVGEKLSSGRIEEIRDMFQAYADGFWTNRELHNRLDAQQIRGTWSSTNWTGFDYRKQGWITVTVTE